MFGGECWITKIVTVLTDCEVKVETCCEGWLKDENDETKKGLNCIRKSGCGGKSILREQNGVVQSLNYPQKYNSRNVLKSVLIYRSTKQSLLLSLHHYQFQIHQVLHLTIV